MAGKCALQLLGRLRWCFERIEERGMIDRPKHGAFVRGDRFKRGLIGGIHRKDAIIHAAECCRAGSPV